MGADAFFSLFTLRFSLLFCIFAVSLLTEKRMKKLKWGFIGCGDVTEHKSGPAFSEIEGSEVVAVMSRQEQKARS